MGQSARSRSTRSWQSQNGQRDHSHGEVWQARIRERNEHSADGHHRLVRRLVEFDKIVLANRKAGSQNFLQQEGQGTEDDEIAIDSVVSHIRQLSLEWKHILTKSAWAQATGSLLSTVAKKIILDVEDLSSLGADEAFRVANLISKIVKLDELFLPEDKSLPQIPTTSQYAPDWLKLHFLSEVLQSDLKDVKFLWFESELSLYFTAEELIELIELSFESNYRTRDAISEIKKNPRPRDTEEEDW